MECNVPETNIKDKRFYAERNVDALISILLHTGAEKSNVARAKDLFHKSHMPIYRAVMSLQRFEQLLRFLRFDDSRNRLNRLNFRT